VRAYEGTAPPVSGASAVNYAKKASPHVNPAYTSLRVVVLQQKFFAFRYPRAKECRTNSDPALFFTDRNIVTALPGSPATRG